ncbi:MAG: aminopeptidase P family protein [Elainellaceae cyanobacterium]
MHAQLQPQPQSQLQPQASTEAPSLDVTLRQRRNRLAEIYSAPVLLWAGQAPSRNFPANVYRFRASSHFLYFAGLPLQGAAIALYQGRMELFMDAPTAASALWHGAEASPEAVAAEIGADAVHPVRALACLGVARIAPWVESMEQVATVAAQDAATLRHQSKVLQRSVGARTSDHEPDRDLMEAIVALRMKQDEGAIAEIRKAAAVSIDAHLAGMAATPNAQTEAQVRAAIESVMMAHNMPCAYNSIVTVEGEVLHNEHYHHVLQPGDLLLADAGAESGLGWASDITRTWPVSGRFSATQRDLYDVVLAAHDACIAQVRPGVEYRDIHLLAARVITEGLISLGILVGDRDTLVERDAHALFFPHGVGHLLGLDVHDMEDLGDVAGYASGRQRSDRFGLCYLRLDRPIEAGMVFTIEPGFYQVPAILNDAERRSRYSDCVNWDRLAQFDDVRGIRIEDDVLVTESGVDVLTDALPTATDAIEEQVGAV